MRNYRSERLDRLFPLYVLVSTCYLIVGFIFTFATKSNPFSILTGIIAMLTILIWTVVRRTSAKRYSWLVFIFFTI